MMDNKYYTDNDMDPPLHSIASNDARMRLGLELSWPQRNGAYAGLSSHLTTGSSGTLSASYPSLGLQNNVGSSPVYNFSNMSTGPATAEHFFQAATQEMVVKTSLLQHNLKNRYRKEVKLETWPPVNNDKYFNLTMYDTLQAEFGKKEIAKNEECDAHDVKSLELEEIFHYNLPNEARVILVEGNAGIGKTFLTQELCKRWSNNTLLQYYRLVIMIQLRDPNIQKSIDLKQLLHYQFQGVGETAVEIISSSGGQSIFLILDGYDELPLKLRHMSIFTEIIQGGCLPNSTVLVTSRRCVSHELHSVASKKIVIIGFNPTQIDHFISVNLELPKAKELMTQLSYYPNVYNLCQVPANLAIIVHLFKLQSRLPATVTELYHQFILNFLFNYMQHTNKHPQIQHLQSIDKLPYGVRSKYWSLCELALLGIKNRQLVFSEEEISKSCLGERIPNEYDGLGLLHITHHMMLAGRSRTYNFIHLTTQEFLAAHYLTTLPSQIVKRAVKKNMTNPDYHTVCRFYAGLTKLKSLHIRKAVFEAFQHLVREVIEKKEHTCQLRQSKKTIINIFHCCYETQDDSLCKIAADFLTEFTLDISDCICLPQDVMAVAHFICKSSKQWKLCLNNCYIRGKGLNILISVLTESKQWHTITSASFNSNRLQLNSAKPLMLLLNTQASLHTLNLKYNQLGDQGVEQLALCLQSNFVLKHLDISYNNITDDGAKNIGLMLQKNSTLQSLFLSNNCIGPIGIESITEGLKSVHSNLNLLNLESNKLGEDGAQCLAEGVQINQTLKILDISNCNIGPAGAYAISQAMNVNPIMTNLNLECNKIIRSPLSKPIICSFFECESLKVLNIRCNSLGPEGTLAIAEGLQRNETLQELDISRTDCNGNSAIQIACSLQANKSLQVLNICDNKIGTAGSEELASSLIQNVTLKCLKMDRTSSSAENFEFFTQMVPFFPVLQILHLCDSSIPSSLILSMCKEIKSSRHSALQELKIHHYDTTTKEKISQLKDATNQYRRKSNNRNSLVINYAF